MNKPTATKFTIDVDVESEETFSIGDFFIHDKYPEVCVLAQVGHSSVAMILLKEGGANIVYNAFIVNDLRNISKIEFSRIVGKEFVERYTKLKSVTIEATV